jgi:hypothetical protein
MSVIAIRRLMSGPISSDVANYVLPLTSPPVRLPDAGFQLKHSQVSVLW